MAKIFLSVPILGKPELKMMFSTYQAIFSSEHQVRIFFNENDSLISRVRNVHLSTFYYDFPEYDYFMSIDSDLEIMNTHLTNNIFTKLVNHDIDFVGGLYSIKKEGASKCSSVMMDAADNIPFDSGLREVRWLSSGCWCIKRSVVKKMIEAYPELEYDGDDNAAGKKVHGLYIPMLYDMHPGDFEVEKTFRKYLSEDWSMCERWRAIGGKIFADTSIALNHIGKYSYKIWNVKPVEKQQIAPSVPTPAPGFELPKQQG